MVSAIRKQYNSQFTPEKYKAYLHEMANLYPGQLDFRLAETPVFVPADFLKKLTDTCQYIIDVISTPEYLKQSERAIPPKLYVPNEDAQPQFISFDFGICLNDRAELEPQLIELQAFPTLFLLQMLMPEVSSHHYNWPQNYSAYLGGYDKDSYIKLLKNIIIGDSKPENVILLELFPHQQKTRVDFYATEEYLGIKPVCLTEVIQEGNDLFYMNNGQKTAIHRIYNRVIFDELLQQSAEVQQKGKLFQMPLNVTWVPHPNWFYRISKFTLPFLNHSYIPYTQFLNEVTQLPVNLNDYVIKPLFSFAGQGVIIDVTQQDIEAIKDPQNWILQKKVTYANAIETPTDNAKAELRIFYFLNPETKKYEPANNLARLSKGKMIGVRYNKDKDWVGGTFSLFEQ